MQIVNIYSIPVNGYKCHKNFTLYDIAFIFTIWFMYVGWAAKIIIAILPDWLNLKKSGQNVLLFSRLRK